MLAPVSPPPPRIVAHRGNAAEFPENTLPALRSALELGVSHVEFDVHLSADHVPVLLHDANLKRTAGLDKSALSLDIDELSKVRVGEPERFGDRFADTAIPTLADAVNLLEAFPRATAFVEIKRASLRAFGQQVVVQRICEALRPIASQCVVISFDLAAVNLVRASANLPIGWVLSDLSALTTLKCEAVAPEYLFCDHRLLDAPGTRLWRGPWAWAVYEVTTADLALRLAAAGAAYVETMAVRKLLAELREGPAS